MEFTKEDLARRHVTFASIFPDKRVELRPFNPKSQYVLDAAPCPYEPGKYVTIIIPDCYQSTYAGENRGNYPHPVEAIKIAYDLKKCWVENTPLNSQDSGPGIWICEKDLPTDEELDFNYQRQRAYAIALMEQADAWYRDNLAKYIQPIHRIMAKWANINDKKWLPEAYSERDNCPLCRKLIDKLAIFCPECNKQIKAMPEEFELLNSPRKVVPTFPKKPETVTA